MTVVTAALFGAAAAWVATGRGGAPGTRLAGAGPEDGPPLRTGLPLRALALTLAGVLAVAVSATLFGPVGVVVAVGGCAVLWVRARRTGERPDRLPVTSDLPVVIGLISSGIRAGATLPVCLTAVSGAAGGRLGGELSAVAEQLRLGADPASAWSRSSLPAPLAAAGRDLARAADTGAPVADLLDRHVVDLRRALRTRATARVERLGVLVVAPLGLCFLPAFVLIGIVPMAAELLSRALGG